MSEDDKDAREGSSQMNQEGSAAAAAATTTTTTSDTSDREPNEISDSANNAAGESDAGNAAAERCTNASNDSSTEDPKCGDSTKQPQEEKASEDETIEPPSYFPRPGDLCVIRYDCYRLSPLTTTLDRRGRSQIIAEDYRPRQRNWVEGNFEDRSLLEGCDRRPSQAPPPHAYGRADPYCDGPRGNGDGSKARLRRPLKLPSLEFEVGTGDVVRGLEVVVQRMAESEIVEATVPHLYAYGYKGLYPMIPPKTDLVFVVLLEEVIPTAFNARAFAKGLSDQGSRPGLYRRSFTLAIFCCGLLEGILFVVVGIAIPVLLLLRSELQLEDVIRDMGVLVM
jgi:hypothetical protein